MKKNWVIYCDMDGVLTDFIRAYMDITGIDITNTFNNDDDFWNPIHHAGIKFWSEMRWMPDGKVLWNYISKYDPILLSAPSSKIESKVGKSLWVARELPNTRLILRSSDQKCNFATPNSILIDDMVENIQSWTNRGGVGIYHKSAELTINELKKIGI